MTDIFPQTDARLLRRLQDSWGACVIAHKNPDGDAIASSLAMREILREMGKECVLLNDGPFLRPDISRFSSEFLQECPESFLERKPLVIVLDCSTPDRPGNAFGKIEALPRIVIDHHSTGLPFSEEGMSYIVPDSPSTTLCIDVVREALGVRLTKKLAYYLYFGFLTDTGSYHFLSERQAPSALRRVASFTDAGVSPYDVYDEIHDGAKLKDIKDAASIVANAESLFDGQLIICVQPKELSESRISDQVYNQLMESAGLKLIVFFKEKKLGGYELGFRSKHHAGIDVGKLASQFGGGGHMHASGATVLLPFDEARSLIIAEAAKYLS